MIRPLLIGLVAGTLTGRLVKHLAQRRRERLALEMQAAYWRAYAKTLREVHGV